LGEIDLNLIFLLNNFKSFNLHHQLDKMLKHSEYSTHTIAFSVAVIGPLIKLLLNLNYATGPPGMYLYWIICLSIYIIILIPFTYKIPLTLVRLIILGIPLEDFSSNLWHSLFSDNKFLPFYNWYTEHFSFLGSLGEPTPYILIPRWYIIALFLYFLITIAQFRKHLRRSKLAEVS